jgi:hypothetical protein
VAVALGAGGLVGVAITALGALVQLGPITGGCALGGLGFLILLVGLVILGTGWLLAASALVAAATNPGPARWPWFAVLGADLLVVLFFSAKWALEGNWWAAVVLTGLRALPLASIAVLLFSALRVQRRRRALIEILVCVLFLALLMPNFVSYGLLGDLTTGLSAPPPPPPTSTSCGAPAASAAVR